MQTNKKTPKKIQPGKMNLIISQIMETTKSTKTIKKRANIREKNT